MKLHDVKNSCPNHHFYFSEIRIILMIHLTKIDTINMEEGILDKMNNS